MVLLLHHVFPCRSRDRAAPSSREQRPCGSFGDGVSVRNKGRFSKHTHGGLLPKRFCKSLLSVCSIDT